MHVALWIVGGVLVLGVVAFAVFATWVGIVRGGFGKVTNYGK